MEAAELTKKYLQEERMMQIASVRAGRPWICTVYYVTDDAYNLYWLSLPSRRHSQDIVLDSRIAVAVAVKFDKPVVGLQAEGTATLVQDAETIKAVMKDYVEKYDSGKDFYDNFIAGNNQHQLYKFTPERYMLFDEVNFNDGVGHEVIF